MRTVVLVVFVLLAVVGLLGFHWVSIKTSAGRKLCIVTKESLSLDTTFVSGDSELLFSIQHPIIASRMLQGKAECGTF